MKFLIDENLPIDLIDIFKSVGKKCFHINEIKKHGQERIPDSILNKYAIYKDYIIVTKDFDFVNSWRNRKVPEKIIFIHHQGTKSELLELISSRLNELLNLLDDYDFIEINSESTRLPFNE